MLGLFEPIHASYRPTPPLNRLKPDSTFEYGYCNFKTYADVFI